MRKSSTTERLVQAVPLSARHSLQDKPTRKEPSSSSKQSHFLCALLPFFHLKTASLRRTETRCARVRKRERENKNVAFAGVALALMKRWERPLHSHTCRALLIPKQLCDWYYQASFFFFHAFLSRSQLPSSSTSSHTHETTDWLVCLVSLRYIIPLSNRSGLIESIKKLFVNPSIPLLLYLRLTNYHDPLRT